MTREEATELLRVRFTPEMTAELVDVLFGPGDRIFKFAIICGAMHVPARETMALVKDIEDRQMAAEVNALAQRIAAAEALMDPADVAKRQLVSNLLKAHAAVYDAEHALLQQITKAKVQIDMTEGPPVTAPAEMRKAWGQIGSARAHLNKLTKQWMLAGRPGIIPQTPPEAKR